MLIDQQRIIRSPNEGLRVELSGSQGGKSVQDFRDWRRAFLARRSLTRANGDMLFAYRTSKEEYLELRNMLAARLAALDGEPWTFGTTAECACFVLYASEWWRREYAGGAWRWTHILESVGPKFNVDVLDRSYAVERGLRAWGHQPSGAGKRYLGAIFAQGGLPLQLVAKGDGAILKLLIRGTRQAQLFAWDSTRLESFFAAHEQELVQHLRDEDIYRLLASVVLTVLSLRHEYRLAGVSNPVELLDRSQPNWRERFPMAVDDSSAEPLFVELVREAAREVKTVIACPVNVSRTLRLRAGGACYELALGLETPSSLSVAALAATCGLSPESLPQVFGLDVIGAARTPLGEGRQLIGGAEATVLLSGRSKRITGDAALHEQLLALRGMGEDIHEPVGIPGADALDESLPWVFAVRDADATLAGLGSCRLAEERCLVAVPEGSDLLPASPDTQVTLKGETEGLSFNRWVYELSGSATVVLEDVRYCIRSGQVDAASDQLVWKGRRSPYAARPWPVYLGVPQLYRLTADGVHIPVGAQDVEWVMPTRNGAPVPNLRAHRGPIDAWLMQGGLRVRRFRMALVSPDARIRFHSGESEREGAIQFHGWGFASAAVPEALASGQDIQPNVSRLELRSEATPPVSLCVAVSWGTSAQPVRLELPFPATGGRFADQTGLTLSAGTALPLRRLHEARAQVFDRNPEAPKHYKLTMELIGAGAGRLMSELAIPIDSRGFGELRLLEIETSIRALMCQSNSLDARVELSICLGHAPIAAMRLTRYDTSLELRALTLSLPNAYLPQISAEALKGAKLRAIPMLTEAAGDIELTQSSSSGVPVGSWELGHLSATKGPWLVYPGPDSSLQMRPTLFQGFAIGIQPSKADSLCPLGNAMSIAESDARTAALAQVVAEMSRDLEHRSWSLVARQYGLLSHLPLSTMDYWRVIAKDMDAAIASVLKLCFDAPSLMARMRDELGVMWEFVPRRTLSAGLNLLSSPWSRQFKLEASDPFIRTLVEPLFRSLGEANPILGELVHLTLFQAGFSRHESVDRLFSAVVAGAPAHLQQLWHGEASLLQRFLLRTHADDRIWPEFGLLHTLVASLETCTPDSALQLRNTCGRELLWMPTAGQTGQYAKNVKGDVANAPLLASLLTQLCPVQSAWRTDLVMAQLRRIRSFDPGWFDVSCRAGMLIALILTEQPQRKNTVQRGRAQGPGSFSEPATRRPAAAAGARVVRVTRSAG